VLAGVVAVVDPVAPGAAVVAVGRVLGGETTGAVGLVITVGAVVTDERGVDGLVVADAAGVVVAVEPRLTASCAVAGGTEIVGMSTPAGI